MEDIVKFLLVIGFIVIGIVKQSKKETDKEAEPDMPVPDAPLPTQPIAQPRKAKKKGKAKPFPQTSGPSPHSTPATPPLAEPQTPEETSEFNIRSAEEARKAIIWSEILNRKY